MKRSDLTPSEYGEFYGGYLNRIEGDAELIPSLENNTEEMVRFLKSIPANKWSHRYQPGKWSILEMVQHLIDTERIFQYRALSFARNEQNPLPGFDHDMYVQQSAGDHRKAGELIKEFRAVRTSGVFMFKSFTDDMYRNIGVMNEANASARAIGFIMIGHALHHKEILSNRYL